MKKNIRRLRERGLLLYRESPRFELLRIRGIRGSISRRVQRRTARLDNLEYEVVLAVAWNAARPARLDNLEYEVVLAVAWNAARPARHG